MKEKLKNIGWSILGFIFLIVIILISILVLKGSIGIIYKLYPFLFSLMKYSFWITIVILLPLSIFKKIRGIIGIGMQIASYVFGVTLWGYSLLLTYDLLGMIFLFLGLILMGIGVVPIAILATLFKGMWEPFGFLILLLIMTFGTRIFGAYLIEKYEEPKTNE